eukprot:4909414-Pleurochrysis_carterae.AAC.2
MICLRLLFHVGVKLIGQTWLHHANAGSGRNSEPLRAGRAQRDTRLLSIYPGHLVAAMRIHEDKYQFPPK